MRSLGHTTKASGEHFISVPKEVFEKWANKLLKRFLDKVEQGLSIVSALALHEAILKNARFVTGEGAAK